MSQSRVQGRRSGFTLIEVLVTLILIGLLAAFVFPVIVPQISSAEPAKMSNDLSSIRTGIEVFDTNVRKYPTDLEDLANQIGATDFRLPGSSTYSTGETNRWNGPYIDASIPSAAGTSAAGFTTGFDASILGGLTCIPSTDDVAPVPTTTCAANSNHFISVEVANLDTTEFRGVNDIVDPGESALTATQRQQRGKLRCVVSLANCNNAYYLATPFHN